MSAPAVQLREPSGPQWVERFPTSRSVADLAEPFQGYVSAFLQALEHATDRVEEVPVTPAAPGHIRAGSDAGPPHPDDPPSAADRHTVPFRVRHAHSHRHRRSPGVHVSIAATFRPPERAYLMHYAFRIARENLNPARVPHKAGVDIDWVHRDGQGQPDLEASRQAAEEMVGGYNIVYRPALVSRHTQGLAIDMNISWAGTLEIRDFDGQLVSIASTPRTGAGNTELHAVGASYQVYKLLRDAPHWSSDGH